MAFQCQFCGRKFSNIINKKEHELIHLNIRVQCDECSKDFSNNANLGKHKREKHSKRFVSVKTNTLYSVDKNKLVCGECGSTYYPGEEDAFDAHIRTHL